MTVAAHSSQKMQQSITLVPNYYPRDTTDADWDLSYKAPKDLHALLMDGGVGILENLCASVSN